jgi:hypothetical protein
LSERDPRSGRFVGRLTVDQLIRGASPQALQAGELAEERIARILAVADPELGLDASRAEAAATLLDWEAIGDDRGRLAEGLQAVIDAKPYLRGEPEESVRSAARSGAMDTLIRDARAGPGGAVLG